MGSVNGEYRFLFRMETRHQEMQWVKRGGGGRKKEARRKEIGFVAFGVCGKRFGLMIEWMDLKERKRRATCDIRNPQSHGDMPQPLTKQKQVSSSCHWNAVLILNDLSSLHNTTPKDYLKPTVHHARWESRRRDQKNHHPTTAADQHTFSITCQLSGFLLVANSMTALLGEINV